MNNKIILKLIILMALTFLLIPEMAFAEGTTEVTVNDAGNYTWDTDGFLDKADPVNAIANIIMTFNVWLTQTALWILKLGINPTEVFLNDSSFSIMTIIEFMFKVTQSLQRIVMVFFPIMMAIYIGIDFTKGEYRTMLNRFAQVFIALLLFYGYGTLVNNPTEMKKVINTTQDISYLILSATSGEVMDNEGTVSMTDSMTSESEALTNASYDSVSNRLFLYNVVLPWEFGEFGYTNLKIGHTPFYNKNWAVESAEGWKEEDLVEKVKNITEGNPVMKDGAKLEIKKETLWRDVITYYPKDSDMRNDLIDVVNNDGTFDYGFSGGSRFGVSALLFIFNAFQMAFWVWSSFLLLITFLMFTLGIPLGSFAFMFLAIPTKGTIRVVKGWVGWMGGAIIGKYLTVLIVGLVLGTYEIVQKMTSGLSESFNGFSRNNSLPSNFDSFNYESFGIPNIIVGNLWFILVIIILWMIKDKISPMSFIRFGAESAFSASRGHKSRMHDPFYMLENKYRRWTRTADRKKDEKKKAPKTDAETNGKVENKKLNKDPEINSSNPNDNLTTPPLGGYRQAETKEKVGGLPDILKTPRPNKNTPLEGQLVDKKEKQKQKLLEAKAKNNQKLLASGQEKKEKTFTLSNGKKAILRYANKPLSDVLKKTNATHSLNRRKTLPNGKFKVETADLPDGRKIMRLTKEKTDSDFQKGSIKKPVAIASNLPSNQIKKNGGKLNKNSPPLLSASKAPELLDSKLKGLSQPPETKENDKKPPRLGAGQNIEEITNLSSTVEKMDADKNPNQIPSLVSVDSAESEKGDKQMIEPAKNIDFDSSDTRSNQSSPSEEDGNLLGKDESQDSQVVRVTTRRGNEPPLLEGVKREEGVQTVNVIGNSIPKAEPPTLSGQSESLNKVDIASPLNELKKQEPPRLIQEQAKPERNEQVPPLFTEQAKPERNEQVPPLFTEQAKPERNEQVPPLFTEQAKVERMEQEQPLFTERHSMEGVEQKETSKTPTSEPQLMEDSPLIRQEDGYNNYRPEPPTVYEQEVMLDIVSQEPMQVTHDKKEENKAPIEILLDDPFDNSYLYDDRLSTELKSEIERHQLDQQDDVYANAVNYVLSKGKASQNLLRKEFQLPIEVARDMISRMESEEIIGKREGTKGHPVLYNKEKFEAPVPKKEPANVVSPSLREPKVESMKEPPPLSNRSEITPTRLDTE